MMTSSCTCCGIILNLIYVYFLQLGNAFDPCYEYLTISNEEKRSPSYNFDLINDIPISDERLTQDWYKIEMDTGSLIPNESPGAFRCGTLYPIWLNGILPSVPKVQVSRQVCVQTTENDCFQTWNINIKFCCGNYLVYELRTSLVDKSAYCFGNVSSGFNVSENNDQTCDEAHTLIKLRKEMGNMSKRQQPDHRAKLPHQVLEEDYEIAVSKVKLHIDLSKTGSKKTRRTMTGTWYIEIFPN